MNEPPLDEPPRGGGRPAPSAPPRACRTFVSALALAFLAWLGTGCAQTDEIALETVADGLTTPVGVVAHDAALYVLEQHGVVRVVTDGGTRGEPFLDLRGRDFASGGERGLLGLAFHPDHPGEVFVHYSDAEGDTVLSRMPVRDGAAAPSEETRMLTVDQPYGNHNGGQLAVGPDGMLYLGLGDGGSGGDPEGNGQDPHSLLGTLLRLDPSGDPVAVPRDNPFADGAEGAPEVWHYGLRNPWRFSFDPATGDLWIADVGQNRSEEVDLVPGNRDAGLNFGWNAMEGDRCFLEEGCDAGAFEPPVITYDHDDGWGRSVTGGHVYRGEALPDLTGAYVFADFTGGVLLVARQDEAGSWNAERLLETGFPVSSLGVDADGELLVLDYGGRVMRLVAP